MIKPISTTNGVPTTALPLLLVLTANGAKDAYEDWKRHESDKQENAQSAYVVPAMWQGPVVQVNPHMAHERNESDDGVVEDDDEEDDSLDDDSVNGNDTGEDEDDDDDEGDEYDVSDDADEVELFRRSGLCRKSWRDICVGDFVLCADRELFPADMILIASSDTSGVAFVETASLDGETNLKVRKTTPACLGLIGSQLTSSPLTASRLKGATVECGLPNANVNTFEGVFAVPPQPSINGGSFADSLGPSEILLRGCKLRNTQWALGIVVYTGKETKIQENSSGATHKVSQVEHLTNVLTLIVLMIQLSVCAIGAVATGIITSNESFRSRTYLDLQDENSAVAAVLTFFTWIALFSNFIPISLVVTMEMVKAVQCYFISKDEEMFHAATKTYAATRTSDLNEELGQVKYTFTDKTGTLTSNVMEFRKCCVGGIEYGLGITQIRRRVLEKQGAEPPPEPVKCT